jgi:hypothetical protein
MKVQLRNEKIEREFVMDPVGLGTRITVLARGSSKLAVSQL